MLSELEMQFGNDPGLFTLSGAIVLAVVNFVIAGLHTRWRRAKETELSFVESQLRDLYAPLRAISHANENTYSKYASVYSEVIKKLNAGETLSSGEARNWLLWNTNVFQPANRRMRDIMLSNAHLFRTGELPPTVLDFISHVESYEALISTLNPDELKLSNEIVHYPVGFVDVIADDYAAVVKRYQKLSQMNGRHLKKLR